VVQSSEQLLTTSQVAVLLGVSAATVVTYADKGLLRVIRLPSGHRRFRRVDVDALLDPGRVA
jgi:excisionase family DNA binding protein